MLNELIISNILFGFFSLLLLLYITLRITRNFTKSKWFCKYLGWHKSPEMIGFDGCSSTGECPVCNKKILQDSQGNWF